MTLFSVIFPKGNRRFFPFLRQDFLPHSEIPAGLPGTIWNLQPPDRFSRRPQRGSPILVGRKWRAGFWERKSGDHDSTQHGKYRSGVGKDFDLLIDINRKMQEGKCRGYKRWAKIFNVKQMSKVLLYLQEHDIRDYDDLQEKTKSSAVKSHELSDAIKEKEARLQDIDRFLKIDEEQRRQQEKTR